jgi:predicted transposase YbfD/YdcC
METRRYTWINDVSWMDKTMREAWKKLGGVGMIESVRRIGEKVGAEVRYSIGSRGVRSGEMFAKASRAHWGIENRLHWVPDVVFREDACRARTGHSARNFSVLRKFVLTVLRKEENQNAACADDGSGPTVMRATVSPCSIWLSRAEA